MRVRLVAISGMLYFPTGGHNEAPSMLYCRHPEGDVDICPWPMKEDIYSIDKQQKLLACALFDERECNETWKEDTEIELPDGTLFDFDLLVD